MKAVKITLVVLAVLFVIAVVAVTFFLGSIIKTGVEKAGPKVMGVPMSLAHARVSLFTGRVRLDRLVIGNPKGFSTDHAFKVESFVVEWVPWSMFSKRILIRNITIDEPDIMFEQTLSGNNFNKIMDNLKSPAPAERQPPAAAGKAWKKSETKVEIDNLVISNGRIGLSMPGMGTSAIPIPLPTLHMTDIGKDQGGASIPDVVTKVFGAIFNSVTKAVTSSAQIVGKGLENVGQGVEAGAQKAGEAATDVGKKVGGAATKATEGIKSLLRGKD